MRLIEFLAMGGYGAYVWSAFGFTALSMIGLFVASTMAAARARSEFEQLKSDIRPRARTGSQPMRARRLSQLSPQSAPSQDDADIPTDGTANHSMER